MKTYGSHRLLQLRILLCGLGLLLGLDALGANASYNVVYHNLTGVNIAAGYAQVGDLAPSPGSWPTSPYSQSPAILAGGTHTTAAINLGPQGTEVQARTRVGAGGPYGGVFGVGVINTNAGAVNTFPVYITGGGTNVLGNAGTTTTAQGEASLKAKITNVSPTNQVYTVYKDGVAIGYGQLVSPGGSLDLDIAYDDGPKNIQVRDAYGRVVYDAPANSDKWHLVTDYGYLQIREDIADSGVPAPQVPPPPPALAGSTNDVLAAASLAHQDAKIQQGQLAAIAAGITNLSGGGSGSTTLVFTNDYLVWASNQVAQLNTNAWTTSSNQMDATRAFATTEALASSIGLTNGVLGNFNYSGSVSNPPGGYTWELTESLSLTLDPDDSRFNVFSLLKTLMAFFIWFGSWWYMMNRLYNGLMDVLKVPQARTAGQSYLGTNFALGFTLICAILIIGMVASLPVAFAALWEIPQAGMLVNDASGAMGVITSLAGSEFVLKVFPLTTVFTAIGTLVAFEMLHFFSFWIAGMVVKGLVGG